MFFLVQKYRHRIIFTVIKLATKARNSSNSSFSSIFRFSLISINYLKSGNLSKCSKINSVLNIMKWKNLDYETRKKIYNEYMNSNLSMRDLSYKYGVSEKTIYNIRRQIERDNFMNVKDRKHFIVHKEQTPLYVNNIKSKKKNSNEEVKPKKIGSLEEKYGDLFNKII